MVCFKCSEQSNNELNTKNVKHVQIERIYVLVTLMYVVRLP